MILYKDERKLDKNFPLHIGKVETYRNDNCDDSFHWHNFCEITLVEKGRGCYLVNGRKYEMAEGDLIIFNNAEAHGWLVESEKMNLTVLIFSMNLLENMNSHYLDSFIERGSNFKNKIDGADMFAVDIVRMIREIHHECNEKREGYQLLVTADVLRLLTLLNRSYQNTDTSVHSSISLQDKRLAMNRLQEGIRYMNENYTEKITLHEVASSVFMSDSYFSAYFKKTMNISFMNYLTELRLKKATELMKISNMTMCDVAMSSGFSNMSNFYRLYKKYIGELPKR